MITRPVDRRGFEIAIICALPLEADAVRALFDHHWDDQGQSPPFGKAADDPNAYSTGAMGCHNVVLVHLPGMGKVSAATVASSCRTSFPGIRLALVVGICGVVPFGPNDEEILLGDVIISDSIAQYDFGRRLPDRFAPKVSSLDSPGRPSPEIRGLLRKLKTIQGQQELTNKTIECLDVLRQIPQLYSTYPGSSNDRLFEADYLHKEDQKSCEEVGCNGKLVLRHRLETNTINHTPAVHFGMVASGDSVMKSGQERDKLASDQGIIAFEMEGIGFWDVFPCLVVKGACDYADSHKSKIWQRYAAATAGACTKAFLAFWTPSNMTLRVPSAQKPQREPVFLVPFDRNDLFVGRGAILEKLRRLLFEKNNRRVALVGLGGIGKTQTALQLAFWTKESKPGYSVFWMPAFSMAGFEQECEKLAKKLNIPPAEHNDAKEAVRLYLSSKDAGNWFLIVDNADDIDIFRNSEQGKGILEFLPSSDEGRILFTTRSKHVAVTAARNAVIKLPQMGSEEAKDLFKSLIDEDDLHDDENVDQLLQILTYLPLAISQAAAYIKIHETPVLEYIRLLTHKDASNAIELLEQGYSDETYHNASQGAVATTWIVSFNQIRRWNPSAANLLSFMALIEPRAIPQSILPSLETEQQMTQAIGTLIGHGFISRRGHQPMFDMHSLVHLVTRKWNKPIHEDMCKMALAHVIGLFPDDIGLGNIDFWQQYLPHALRLLSTEGIPENEDFCRLARWVAHVLLNDEWMNKMESSLEDATTISMRTLREDGPDLLAPQLIHQPAHTHDRRPRKAVELLQRSITVFEKTSTEDDPDRLRTEFVLAMAYLRDGQTKKALDLFEPVIMTRMNKLAAGPPIRLIVEAGFAEALIEDQQHEKAIRMLEGVVAARNETWPGDDPLRLDSQRRLARAYLRGGQPKKAVRILEHVVKIQERVLAEHHQDRLGSQYLLARAYFDEKETYKAIGLLERIVTVEADDDRSWQQSKNLLQRCYKMQGTEITQQ